MLGPTGLGIIYGKEEYLKQFKPTVVGGGMNASFSYDGTRVYNEIPYLLEAGTPNIASVIGFGKVIEGLDVLEQIANVEVITRDKNAESGIDVPVNPPVINQITVDTHGIDYKTPKTIEPFNYYNWLIKKYQSNMSAQ